MWRESGCAIGVRLVTPFFQQKETATQQLISGFAIALSAVPSGVIAMDWYQVAQFFVSFSLSACAVKLFFDWLENGRRK